MRRVCGCTAGLFLVALAGCGDSRPAPAASGAEAVVRAYYDALLRKEWSGAYARLHPDSQAKWSSTQFARLAERHRGKLGFEPSGVTVRSCEEHGSEALAHIVLKPASGSRSYRDAVGE